MSQGRHNEPITGEVLRDPWRPQSPALPREFGAKNLERGLWKGAFWGMMGAAVVAIGMAVAMGRVTGLRAGEISARGAGFGVATSVTTSVATPDVGRFEVTAPGRIRGPGGGLPFPDTIASRVAAAAALFLPVMPEVELANTTVPVVSIAGTRIAVRWAPRGEQPIRVTILDAPEVDGWRPEDRDIVDSAVKAWEDEGIPVRFFIDTTRVTRPSQAAREPVVPGAVGPVTDVVVRWVDHFDHAVSGWTTVTWNDRGDIRHAEVRLALRTPEGRWLTPTQRRTLALHEFGHVLGLGHSADSTAIMSTVIYATRIGATDAMSVQRLYGMTVASRR